MKQLSSIFTVYVHLTIVLSIYEVILQAALRCLFIEVVGDHNKSPFQIYARSAVTFRAQLFGVCQQFFSKRTNTNVNIKSTFADSASPPTHSICISLPLLSTFTKLTSPINLQ